MHACVPHSCGWVTCQIPLRSQRLTDGNTLRSVRLRYSYDDGMGLMTCTAGAIYTMTLYCPSSLPPGPWGFGQSQRAREREVTPEAASKC